MDSSTEAYGLFRAENHIKPLSLYRPLDGAKYEIRILEIEIDSSEGNDEQPPGSGTLLCHLKHESLVQITEYHALSYCWGDHTVTKDINVDGIMTPITVNLEAALQQLKCQRISRVWVDAICINQEDLYERASQLARMGLIYSRATSAIAWLGLASGYSASAIGLLKDLAIAEDGWHASLCFANAADDLSDIFTRPYWRRKWIIQEVSKAQTVQIYCGTDSMLMDDMLRTCLAPLVKAFEAPMLDQLYAISLFRSRERPSRLGAPRLNLAEALVRSRNFLTTDPRDSIYALLGLTSDGNDLIPMPNYVEPLEDVFLRAAWNMVALQGHTSLILLARRRASSSPLLPSWVPEWSKLACHIPKCVLHSVLSDARASLSEISALGADAAASNKISLPVHIKERIVYATGSGGDNVCDLGDANVAALLGLSSGRNAESMLASIFGWLASLHRLDADNFMEEYNPGLNVADSAYALWWFYQKAKSADLDGPIRSTITLQGLRSLRYIIEPCIRHYERCESFKRQHVSFTSTTGYVSHTAIIMLLQQSFRNMATYGLTLAVTNCSLFAVVPEGVRSGDVIGILIGCAMPIVLRPDGDQTWTFVGEAPIRRLWMASSEQSESTATLLEFV